MDIRLSMLKGERTILCENGAQISLHLFDFRCFPKSSFQRRPGLALLEYNALRLAFEFAGGG